MNNFFIVSIPVAHTGVDSCLKNFSGFFVISKESDSQWDVDDGEIDWTIHFMPVIDLQQDVVVSDGIDFPVEKKCYIVQNEYDRIEKRDLII